MEDMLSIVQTITSTAGTDRQLAQLFATLDEHQSFQLRTGAALDPHAAHVSNLLNAPATRHQGLLLLHQLLPQCPLEIIEQKGALWTTLATKVCHSGSSSSSSGNEHHHRSTIPLALRCLSLLLHKSAHVPELSKALSNTLLAKIADAVLAVPPASHRAALALLEQAQRLYPGAVSIARATVEQWILSFADSADEQLVRQSARCLHLLQQTRGGGGQAGAAHKIAWQQLQAGLLAQLHQLLDALYANVPEVMDACQAHGVKAVPLAELALSDEPVARYGQLAQRFRNVCEYLRCALV